jgi:hypothetical protein
MFGAKINRQPGPLNESALQMLRDRKLRKFSKVMTSDDYLVGKVVHLRLRKDEVNVEMKLYAAYLDVASLELGTHFFIPTDFVQEYNPDDDQVLISVPFSVVQQENWNREPAFIAARLEEIESLAE